MGQMYSVVGSASALDSIGDLMELVPATQNPIVIHSIRLGQIDLEADAQAAMAHVKVSTFTTEGTGGTTPTPSPLNPGGEVADATARFLATVDAVTGEVVYIQDSWNVQAGWLYLPTPEERIWVTSAAGLTIKNMEVQTAAIITLTVVFEEFKMV